jgi:hypothetical protein
MRKDEEGTGMILFEVMTEDFLGEADNQKENKSVRYLSQNLLVSILRNYCRYICIEVSAIRHIHC